jgi:hypothetical protein
MATRKAPSKPEASKASSEPTHVHALRGRVAEGPFARGSKSEQVAVFLETRAARYVLRRRDGPAYADQMLRELVGCNVECDGIIVSYVLIADRIEPIREPV